MSKTKKYYLGILVALLSWSIGSAQDINQIRAKYNDQLAVYLKKSKHLTIGVKSDSIHASAISVNEVFYLDDKSNIFSSRSIYTSQFVKVSDINAYTMIPSGAKYKEVKVKDFEVKDVDEPGIFYNDLQSIQFVFPHVKKDCKTFYTYKETFIEPRLIGAFYFAAEAPVEYSEYKVTYDKNIKIGYKLFGINASEVQHTKTEKGKLITETWVLKEVPKIESEGGAPNFRYYTPQIFVYVTEAFKKGAWVGINRDENDLYNWCYGFIEKMNKDEESKLKQLTDSLTANSKDNLEKSKKIFYWVQDHIKYVAFEDGYGGFIPRTAADVFRKRYGDCKDMANIIVTMHKMAGMEAFHTWIGSRDLPYSIKEVPTTSNFNHMIAAVKLGDEYVFLDATGRYEPFGYVTSMIQGKEGLIGKSKDTFEIVKVKEMPYTSNRYYDSIVITADGGVIKGKGKRVLTGYPKIEVTYPIEGKSKEKRDELVKNYLVIGNNKCLINNYDIRNLNDKEKPLEFEFDFLLHDYVNKSSNELYVNLNLSKDLKNSLLPKDRKTSLERDYKYEIKETVVFEIPKGFKLGYLPENSSLKEDNFGFTINYKISGNTVTYNKTIYIDYLQLHKDKFESWNNMVKELNKAYKENISIIKK
ncbi:MAG TPA: transglutaminase domain-containing protein [Cytophagaceae bacterium]